MTRTNQEAPLTSGSEDKKCGASFSAPSIVLMVAEPCKDRDSRGGSMALQLALLVALLMASSGSSAISPIPVEISEQHEPSYDLNSNSGCFQCTMLPVAYVMNPYKEFNESFGDVALYMDTMMLCSANVKHDSCDVSWSPRVTDEPNADQPNDLCNDECSGYGWFND